MNTIYTVYYFINKFEATKECDWTSGIQQNEYGQRCAYGHCMYREKIARGYISCGDGERTPEGKALNLLFFNAGIFHYSGSFVEQTYGGVACVNNGHHPKYQQPTERQRILAALYDIKKLQEPNVKEVIRYVSVSESLKKQTKELIEN